MFFHRSVALGVGAIVLLVDMTLVTSQQTFMQDSKSYPTNETLPVPLDMTPANHTLEEDLEFWPWHKRNKTEEKGCNAQLDCYDCSTYSSFCHWCEFDQKCHRMGSPHGCLSGIDCSNKTDPSKEDKSCGSHKTCGECAASSMTCHWCAHDNACHVVGSAYGCLTGVDCYSNDRCMRKDPVKMKGFFFQDMGWIPFGIIMGIAGFCCCCASLCFGAASNVKGAYDDMIDVASAASARGDSDRYGHDSGPRIRRLPSHFEVVHEDYEYQHTENRGDDSNDVASEAIPDPEMSPTEEQALSETEALLPSQPVPSTTTHPEDPEPITEFSLMTDFPESTGTTLRRRNTRPTTRRSRNMGRIYEACRVIYYINIFVIFCFVVASIRFFPKIPEINVCSSPFAWKSIVDSMTSMKVEAHFELLISVSNPNHFDVAIDMGQGTFSHDDAYVGSYEIPPTTVPAASLSDLLIIATFTPEKWQAFSLSEEYYKGTLVLTIGTEAVVRVPSLANFTYRVDTEGYKVKVSDPKFSDRHLCSCQTPVSALP